MKITSETITPQLVLDLYRKHDLRPCPVWLEVHNGHCCGMGVISLELGYRDERMPGEGVRETFGHEFVCRFEDGFDLGILGQRSGINVFDRETQLGYDSAVLAYQELLK